MEEIIIPPDKAYSEAIQPPQPLSLEIATNSKQEVYSQLPLKNKLLEDYSEQPPHLEDFSDPPKPKENKKEDYLAMFLNKGVYFPIFLNLDKES